MWAVLKHTAQNHLGACIYLHSNRAIFSWKKKQQQLILPQQIIFLDKHTDCLMTFITAHRSWHFSLKGLEHRMMGLKVLILKYTLVSVKKCDIKCLTLKSIMTTYLKR